MFKTQKSPLFVSFDDKDMGWLHRRKKARFFIYSGLRAPEWRWVWFRSICRGSVRFLMKLESEEVQLWILNTTSGWTISGCLYWLGWFKLGHLDWILGHCIHIIMYSLKSRNSCYNNVWTHSMGLTRRLNKYNIYWILFYSFLHTHEGWMLWLGSWLIPKSCSINCSSWFWSFINHYL